MIDMFLKLEPLFSHGMSQFQMDKFVINENITPYKKLKQAVIEARTRIEVQTTTSFELEELHIKKQKAEFEEMSDPDQFVKKLKNIEVRKLNFEINRTTARLSQLQMEAEFFLKQIEKIVNENFNSIDAAIESLSDFEYQNEQELEYWTHKLSRSVYSDLINYGTISKGVLEAIACLTDQQQMAILSEAAIQQTVFHKLLDNSKDLSLVAND